MNTAALRSAENRTLLPHSHVFFSGVPMKCCHVDTWPENTIVGLPPSWVDTDVCRLYIGIIPQPGCTRATSRSPAISWWSEWRTGSSLMILSGIWTCHVAKGAESSCFNDTGNWRAAGSLHAEALVTCMVYGIRRIFRRHHVSKASSHRAYSLLICVRHYITLHNIT